MASPAQSAFLPLAAMMFATGIGIPIFAAFNSALGTQLGSPFASTAVTFAFGLVMALALVALTGFPAREAWHMQQPHIWFESCQSCYGRFYDAGEYRDLAVYEFSDFMKRFSVIARD